MTALPGAHVSTKGGLATAAANRPGIAADAIQIFTRNQVQWRATPVSKQEAAAFREAIAASGLRMVIGSRLDRHAAIGRGCLGIEVFRRIVNDARFDKIPMVLETPGGFDAWREELALLRSLTS